MSGVVLVGCEESQTITKAFRKAGVEAYSNDIKPSSGGHPEWHIQGDIFEAILKINPTILIAHPPCTYVSSAGLHWCGEKHGEKGAQRRKLRDEAVDFFFRLWNLPIKHICLENPGGYISRTLKPSQRIEPYFFGDPHLKRTMLWLKGLPKLIHVKEDDLFYTHTHTHTSQSQSHSIQLQARRDISRTQKTDLRRLVQRPFLVLQMRWQISGVALSNPSFLFYNHQLLTLPKTLFRLMAVKIKGKSDYVLLISTALDGILNDKVFAGLGNPECLDKFCFLFKNHKANLSIKPMRFTGANEAPQRPTNQYNI